jgi:hypothetical protein
MDTLTRQAWWAQQKRRWKESYVRCLLDVKQKVDGMSEEMGITWQDIVPNVSYLPLDTAASYMSMEYQEFFKMLWTAADAPDPAVSAVMNPSHVWSVMHRALGQYSIRDMNEIWVVGVGKHAPLLYVLMQIFAQHRAYGFTEGSGHGRGRESGPGHWMETDLVIRVIDPVLPNAERRKWCTHALGVKAVHWHVMTLTQAVDHVTASSSFKPLDHVLCMSQWGHHNLSDLYHLDRVVVHGAAADAYSGTLHYAEICCKCTNDVRSTQWKASHAMHRIPRWLEFYCWSEVTECANLQKRIDFWKQKRIPSCFTRWWHRPKDRAWLYHQVFDVNEEPWRIGGFRPNYVPYSDVPLSSVSIYWRGRTVEAIQSSSLWRSVLHIVFPDAFRMNDEEWFRLSGNIVWMTYLYSRMHETMFLMRSQGERL